MNEFSQAERRRIAAKAHRMDLLNARGEVECSECGAEVNEARGNRNAQELEREKVRKNKGPICNACQASWRYSHHQDSEMEMENADAKICATCGHREGKHLQDNAHGTTPCEDCDTNCRNFKEMRNADPATCKVCKDGMDEHNSDGDCMNCGKKCGPRSQIQNASGCGICGEKGHVYDVDGDKKILCEKHAAEAGGVLLSNADRPPTEHEIREYHAKNHKGTFHDCELCGDILEGKTGDLFSNADNAKCQCGHTYDQHEEDSDGAKGAAGSMPCTKCGCHSYYPERGFKDHLKGVR